jgi:hypothetical protein
MLTGYIACRERFRIRHIEGLAPTEAFAAPLVYGNMWHICEEHLAAKTDWVTALKSYAMTLAKEYPIQQADVDKWYNCCLTQFPIYVDYWKRHRDVEKRIPIFQEEKFDYKLLLPSGREIRHRGKLDSCDSIGREGIYLQENKSKSDVDKLKLMKQLNFDVQTMTYIIALEHDPRLSAIIKFKKVSGVRYNVIRRPLSGGKGSITQHKGSKNVPPETKAEFYARLRQVFIDNADTFFVRFRSEVSEHDKLVFREQFLDPVFENLLDDYEWWAWAKRNDESHYNYLVRQEQFPHHINRCWRLPFGGYNPVADGRTSDMDNYLITGSTVGLHKVTNFFPELV